MRRESRIRRFDSIAFLADERWNTIGPALATVAAVPALNFIMLGGSVWHAFGDSTIFTQTVVLEQDGAGREKTCLQNRACAT
jgi:hypothetical protein